MNFESLQTFGDANFLPVTLDVNPQEYLNSSPELTNLSTAIQSPNNTRSNEVAPETFISVPFTIAVIDPGIIPDFSTPDSQSMAEMTTVSLDYNSNYLDETNNSEILNNSDESLKAIQPQDMHINLDVNVDANVKLEGMSETMCSEKENDEDLLNLPTSDLITDEFWPSELNEYLIQKTQYFDLEEYIAFNDTNTQKKIKKKRKPKRRIKPLKPPKPPKIKQKRPSVHVKITKTNEGLLLYCCPECNLGYTDKYLLERHLTTHKADRRFICEVCGVAMKRKEHIQRHKLGHKDERPFSCSICNKGFKRKEHLDVHFVIHSGDEGKTHICLECGKGFYRRDHLTTHQKSHVRKKIKRQQKLAQNIVKNKTRKKSIRNEEASVENSQEMIIHVPTDSNELLPIQIQLDTSMIHSQNICTLAVQHKTSETVNNISLETGS